MAEVSDVVAAVDVGGTRIKAALVTAAYDTVAAVTTPTPKDIAADIGAVVHATVTDLLAGRRRTTARLGWSAAGSSSPAWWTRRAASACSR